jgi:Amt family ammonium transporter
MLPYSNNKFKLFSVLLSVSYQYKLNKVMGFKVSESEENIGLDQTQHGEVAYNT